MWLAAVVGCDPDDGCDVARDAGAGGFHPAGCGPIADCPVTDRLRARLVQLSQPSANGPGPLTEFCRCQNGASSMTVTGEVGAAGGWRT